MTRRIYGRTKTGKPIDDEMIEALADEAQRGYEPGQLQERPRGRGHPALDDAVHLDPELRDETARRALKEGVTSSEIISRALRQYLRSA